MASPSTLPIPNTQHPTPSPAHRIHWKGLETGGAAYHAALFAVEQAVPFRIPPHRHDFFEMMLVREGAGEHPLTPAGGTPRISRFRRGDLVFLRPDDIHAIVVPPGGRLHWINIAFPAASWYAFRAAAGLAADAWDDAPLPAAVNVEGRLPEATDRFEEALRRFQAHRALGAPAPDRLNLCRFLADAVPLLCPSPDAAGDVASITGHALTWPDAPPWLRRACRTLERDPEAAAAGVARFVDIAGVSYAHLARTLKTATGRTPTEYVNGLRLARAALLLTTTARPIVDISGECGFGQLSYFYRLFRKRFGASPDAYRRAARRPLAP